MVSHLHTLISNVELGRATLLSPYLFVLCAEVLASAIRENKQILGLRIEHEEVKISQFADDTTLFLKNVESGHEAFKLLHRFEKISGLRLNTEKSEAMWLGPLKHCEEKPFGIKWPKSVKILGIHFSHNKPLQETLNFGSIIPSIKQIINIWKQRHLTLFGKITIIKSLLLSKLTYKANLLQMPVGLIKEVSKIVYEFLWNGPDKVKRIAISGDYRLYIDYRL